MYYINAVRAGWGDWAGPGATGIAPSSIRRRDKALQQLADESSTKKALRRDSKISNVMFSEKRVKTAAKFKVSAVPHPFSSMEEYERTMRMPLGGAFACRGLIFEFLGTQ